MATFFAKIDNITDRVLAVEVVHDNESKNQSNNHDENLGISFLNNIHGDDIASYWVETYITGAQRNAYAGIGSTFYRDQDAFVSPRPLKVCAMGDSLTAFGYYETRLSSLLNAPVINKGISGNTTAQMLSRFSVDTAECPFVIIWGGINDNIGLHSSVSTITENLQSMYTQAHNQFKKVIGVYITPFRGNQYWGQEYQDVLLGVNSWISSSNSNYKIDAYSLLQENNGFLKSQYDSGDGLHLNVSGYNAVADLIYNSVNWNAY